MSLSAGLTTGVAKYRHTLAPHCVWCSAGVDDKTRRCLPCKGCIFQSLKIHMGVLDPATVNPLNETGRDTILLSSLFGNIVTITPH
jgi:hypothetical protein